MTASYSCLTHRRTYATPSKNTKWKDDLLYYYLCEYTEPINLRIYNTHFRKWYWKLGATAQECCCNRIRVYKLLTEEGKDTNPTSEDEIKASIIPWNQLNDEFVKHCDTEINYAKQKYGKDSPKIPKKAKERCGSVVKVFFATYMKFPSSENHNKLLKTQQLNTVTIIDICKKIIKNLSEKKPVRINLSTASEKHYIGIVGRQKEDFEEDKNFQFLCIEPWPRNSLIKYGNPAVSTKFLCIVEYKHVEKTLYALHKNGRKVEVTSVEVWK